ncbi:MAG: hypothetical protein JHD16_12285 [Solirubrobacteraceae bacterium]|nr:hypothetical protein [Solirubrobacteraceae bacterium]
MSMSSRLASASVTALLALGLASSATAAPVVGPSTDAFYSPPTSVPASGAPGELIWYRPATVNLGAGAPATNNWTILYRSRDSAGNSNFVTGTVFVPRSGYAGNNVAYAFGTQGLAKTCAPSKQVLAANGGTEYESPNLVAALQKGYAVLASDYAGYTNGSSPSYLAGKSQGQAVLDMIRAAKQLPPATVKNFPSGKNVIWGFSQGGQSAGWAGELAPTYYPELNLAGVAAGGVPGDFIASARYLNGAEGASFLLGGVIGLSTEYPQGIPFDDLANAAGQTARTQALASGCVFKLLNQYRNANISTYVKNNQSLEQLLQIPSVRQTLEAQSLGTKKINTPVYQWHGQADEFLPLNQAYATKKAWCAKGTNVKFDLYPSEHLTSLFQAAPSVMAWAADRFAGRSQAGNCNNGKPDPVSNADTPGGDFVVNLDNWNLSGSVRLRTLNQTLALPTTSRFNGTTNLTTQKLDGLATIPPFFTTIDILGIKVRTAITLVPTGRIAGSVNLDDTGKLTINATAPLILRIESLNAVGLTFGTNCRTQTSLQIPVRYSGPVSALGTGKLTSSTTATIPPLTDCGAYGPLLSALVSSTGNGFTLTESPPAPVSY